MSRLVSKNRKQSMFSLLIKFLAILPRDGGVGDHLFWAVRVDKTLKRHLYGHRHEVRGWSTTV